MPLVADRFFRVGEEGEILDLATGGAVRLTLEAAGTQTRERGAACDRLAGLRHPLLLPLVDYGMYGTRWFEAHARLPALRIAGVQARDAALHLVRFLRTAGVELDAALSARNVRAAIEAPAAPWRPIGVWLRWRAAVDAVRSVIESPGPPGVTAITLHAPEGGGLHTARLQIARAARLAGFVPMDSRFGALEEAMRPARWPRRLGREGARRGCTKPRRSTLRSLRRRPRSRRRRGWRGCSARSRRPSASPRAGGTRVPRVCSAARRPRSRRGAPSTRPPPRGARSATCPWIAAKRKARPWRSSRHGAARRRRR